MTPDKIRNTILKAIYSDNDLKEDLVLKGGNALKFYDITDRASQDLDFSIKESIRYQKENEGEKLRALILDAFRQVGFLVVGFKFIKNIILYPFFNVWLYYILFNLVSNND